MILDRESQIYVQIEDVKFSPIMRTGRWSKSPDTALADLLSRKASRFTKESKFDCNFLISYPKKADEERRMSVLSQVLQYLVNHLSLYEKKLMTYK